METARLVEEDGREVDASVRWWGQRWVRSALGNLGSVWFVVCQCCIYFIVVVVCVTGV